MPLGSDPLTFEDFRAELEDLGLTQMDFARMTKSTPQRISKWKHAALGVPLWVRPFLWMYRRLPAKVRGELLNGESK